MSDYDRQQRKRRFEEFEQRLVMSANALTNVSPELMAVAQDVAKQVQIATVLEEAHSQTGVDTVHEQYGFDGAGQTVAVIDSGIAWDHYAFSDGGDGGYGAGARVVGGYDFAENDDNPYDDGPAGYHGTHIAGIIGSSDENNLGVASGVDLVSLRVFDDAGNGSLEWVEQALQWVHENKDSFENPITTVNLSIGTDWNAETVPGWATLEDEFAQLEADGIFVSVAAGNSFQNFNETGLSYPAVSPYVVPVASHGADGSISDFSQRDSGVLVAPGESIRSAVPGHILGTDANDRYLGSSGTSMAAPYVAGASALLRQANEFVGNDNIDQDLLYNQFLETADRIYDSVTENYYYRINVEAAIDAVVGDAHHGNYDQATEIGAIENGTSINGTIGKLTDTDAFKFTASETGSVTFTFETTHNLNPFLGVDGHSVTIVDNQITFDVTAGQEYSFQIGSEFGIGHYQIEVAFENAPRVDAIDLGASQSREFAPQRVQGQQWYQVTAARQGILTLVTNGDASGQNLQVQIYDADMNEVKVGSTTNGTLRLDTLASEGDEYFVKVITEDANVQFQVTNLVSIRSGSLVVNGTSGDDNIQITDGEIVVLDVNGTSYSFNSQNLNSITVLGGGGNDTLTTNLGAGDDSLILREDFAFARSEQNRISAYGFENTHFNNLGGDDQVVFFDSIGNDVFENDGQYALMTGDNFRNSADGFSRVVVHADSGGYDVARLNGTEGSDRFLSTGQRDVLRSDGNMIVVSNFDRVEARGNGGEDRATLITNGGNNEVKMNQRFASVQNASETVTANGFERINVKSNADTDTLIINDSAGRDVFTSVNGTTVMAGEGYLGFTRGFGNVVVNSTSGNDLAILQDTASNDTLVVTDGSALLFNNNQRFRANGFEGVIVRGGTGGFDSASLYGTSGNDALTATLDSTTLVSSRGNSANVTGFDRVSIDLGSGTDSAFLQGSAGNETLKADGDLIEFKTVLQELRLRNADQTHFDGNGGLDEVNFSDFDELDLLTALGDKASAYLDQNRIVVEDFDFLQATTAAGHSSNHDIDAVDYLFMLGGNWQSQ